MTLIDLWNINYGMVLIYMAKYIKNKKIDTTKSNEVNNLKDISEATWKFVSAFYNARWDLLVADVHSNTFRQKVLLHYIPKTNPVKNSNPKDKKTDKLASIERLSHLISAKTSQRGQKDLKIFQDKGINSC